MSDKILKIFEAKQALNQFLAEHPHLIPAQRKINELLAGAVTQDNRIALLTRLMKANTKDLENSLKDLALAMSKNTQFTSQKD